MEKLMREKNNLYYNYLKLPLHLMQNRDILIILPLFNETIKNSIDYLISLKANVFITFLNPLLLPKSYPNKLSD
jgi:hypothetical protein